MGDVLGLTKNWRREERETHKLGEMRVVKKTIAFSTRETQELFSVLTIPNSIKRKPAVIEGLNIHQLRDLRTLLNHILGEEGS